MKKWKCRAIHFNWKNWRYIFKGKLLTHEDKSSVICQPILHLVWHLLRNCSLTLWKTLLGNKVTLNCKVIQTPKFLKDASFIHHYSPITDAMLWHNSTSLYIKVVNKAMKKLMSKTSIPPPEWWCLNTLELASNTLFSTYAIPYCIRVQNTNIFYRSDPTLLATTSSQ
jgi:hypothetical protein